MDIRLALKSDLRGIQRCAHRAYEKYVVRIGKRPAPMIADFEQQIIERQLHVLMDGKAVAGFVVYYQRDDCVHLENVAVDPQHQGLGLGIQLIKYVEAAAAQLKVGAVELYTNAKMTENLKLYPYLGYVEVGRWHEDGFDRVFYKKDIAT